MVKVVVQLVSLGYLSSVRGKMLDTIAFPKKEQDEANDLNELTK
jgi:hypothetical protein